MKRVNAEERKKMKEMKEKGFSFEGIGRALGFSASTVQYHTSEETKKKAIIRAKNNKKVWPGTKEYNKKYQAERRKNDPEFLEKSRKANRENWRKKHGKSSNLS